nr:DinB family protein [uncultured Fluviicola sp.]
MDITSQIETLKNQRTNLLLQLEGLSNEDIGLIPAGHNNNILWNLGHILVVPQYYFYVANGHSQNVEQYYIQNYMSGSYPKATNIDKEYNAIKVSLLPTLDALKSDFEKDMFKDFKAFGDLDFISTLEFLIKHEAGHLNTINNLLSVH